jgi:signal transduction histidine kinase/CheY-like chemotaxis protein
MVLQILHLEDNPEDAFLIQRALSKNFTGAEVLPARDRSEFLRFLNSGRVDLILADSGVPGFSGFEALEMAHRSFPGVPFICLSGSEDERHIKAAFDAGADDFVQKDQTARLIASVRSAIQKRRMTRSKEGMARLVKAVQELSMARDLNSIMAIVRLAARELTGSDGATFVLRDGDQCFYADEDAISPLWKGQRLPMSACISGWVMLNRQLAVIEDVHADSRISAEAYRPTFVKSLVMVPIRTDSPIGAIGNYWAERRQPGSDEVEWLEALANTTAVAMENIRIHGELERRVQDRTSRLATANQELESFAFAVSHDLGAPLRSIRGYAELLLKECSAQLDESARMFLEKVHAGTKQMRELMDALLRLSRVSQTEMQIRPVNLTELARGILRQFADAEPDRKVEVRIADEMEADGDYGLLCVALEHLLANAWKFTSKSPSARIEFEFDLLPDGRREYCVRDNGAGFDMQYSEKLFQPFRRFHLQDEFPGSGIGLSAVKRIIDRHLGTIRVEAEVGKGAAFHFTLGSGSEMDMSVHGRAAG